jgi:hypothetical protein
MLAAKDSEHIKWKLSLLLFLILAVGITIFYAQLRPFQCSLVADPLIYLGGAKSIVEGSGYSNGFWVNSPRIGFYPPGQSWLLATIWRLYPEYPSHADVYVWWMIFWSWLAIGGAFCLCLACGLPYWICLPFAAMWSLSPTWLNLVLHLSSDVPFIAVLSWLSFFWMIKREGKLLPHWVLTGIFLSLAILLRTAALPLALAAILASLCQAIRLLRPALIAACFFAHILYNYLLVHLRQGCYGLSAFGIKTF